MEGAGEVARPLSTEQIFFVNTMISDKLRESFVEATTQNETKLGEIRTILAQASESYQKLNERLTAGNTAQEELTRLAGTTRQELQGAQGQIAQVQEFSRQLAVAQAGSQTMLQQVATQELAMMARIQEAGDAMKKDVQQQSEKVNDMVRTAINSLMPENTRREGAGGQGDRRLGSILNPKDFSLKDLQERATPAQCRRWMKELGIYLEARP